MDRVVGRRVIKMTRRLREMTKLMSDVYQAAVTLLTSVASSTRLILNNTPCGHPFSQPFQFNKGM